MYHRHGQYIIVCAQCVVTEGSCVNDLGYVTLPTVDQMWSYVDQISNMRHNYCTWHIHSYIKFIHVHVICNLLQNSTNVAGLNLPTLCRIRQSYFEFIGIYCV